MLLQIQIQIVRWNVDLDCRIKLLSKLNDARNTIPQFRSRLLRSKIHHLRRVNRGRRLSYRLHPPATDEASLAYIGHRNVHQANRPSYKQMEFQPKAHMTVQISKICTPDQGFRGGCAETMEA